METLAIYDINEKKQNQKMNVYEAILKELEALDDNELFYEANKTNRDR